MAITRAQQAKQMLREGGRIGFFSAGLARGENISPGTSTTGGMRDDNEATRGGPPGTDVVTKPPVKDKYGDETQKRLDDYREKFINEPVKFPKYTPSYLKILEGPLSKGQKFTRKFNFDKVAKAGRYQYTDPITGETYTFDQDLALENPEIFEAASKQLLQDRNAGEVDAYGNPLNQGDDGPDNTILFPQDTTPGDGDDSDDDDDTNTGGLALRFRKDGGRINAMDGGMMSPEGGIMDLETGRQMYFLGKLVKKATRAVKKIVKSPIGKAAILGGAMYFGGGAGAGKLGSFFGKGSFNPLKALGVGPQTGKFVGSGLGNLLAKFGLAKEGALTGKGLLALGGGALTLSPLLFQEDDDEEDQTIDRGPGLDIAAIRANPYDFLGQRFRAEEGGKAEPVAKKTMPLLDMGGKEMALCQ